MQGLESLKKSLERLESKLYGLNYECHLSIVEICDSVDPAVALERINEQFDLRSPVTDAPPVKYGAFIDEVSEKLSYRGDRGAGPQWTPAKYEAFETELGAWKALIRQKFNPAKTKIYRHPGVTEWIFWNFCFLIASRERGTTYCFEGIASD